MFQSSGELNQANNELTAAQSNVEEEQQAFNVAAGRKINELKKLIKHKNS